MGPPGGPAAAFRGCQRPPGARGRTRRPAGRFRASLSHTRGGCQQVGHRIALSLEHSPRKGDSGPAVRVTPMPAHSVASPAVPARGATAQWICAVLLAFIAGLLWSRSAEPALPAALAQSPPAVGARGVYAFTGQLDRNRFGLFMLDVEQGTIWCYELDEVGGVRKLRLTAARSWIYDRYLRDFNCAPPDFREVQELVAQQRALPSAATSPPATSAAAGADPANRDPPPEH